MKRTDFPTRWLVAVLLLSLLLVACERPLQQDVTIEASTAEPDNQLEGTPSVIEPDATNLQTPELQPSATEATSGETPGTDTGPDSGEESTEPVATAEPITEAEDVGPTEDVIHTVVAGETLNRIATNYGVSIEAIAAANNISNIHTLDVGQQLLIPLSGTTEAPAEEEEPAPAGEEQIRVVQPGDTLYSIGRHYGFTVEELMAYNNLTNPNRLEVGQQLRIPPPGYAPDQ